MGDGLFIHSFKSNVKENKSLCIKFFFLLQAGVGGSNNSSNSSSSTGTGSQGYSSSTSGVGVGGSGNGGGGANSNPATATTTTTTTGGSTNNSDQLSRTNLYIRGLTPNTTDKDLEELCRK